MTIIQNDLFQSNMNLLLIRVEELLDSVTRSFAIGIDHKEFRKSPYKGRSQGLASRCNQNRKSKSITKQECKTVMKIKWKNIVTLVTVTLLIWLLVTVGVDLSQTVKQYVQALAEHAREDRHFAFAVLSVIAITIAGVTRLLIRSHHQRQQTQSTRRQHAPSRHHQSTKHSSKP